MGAQRQWKSEIIGVLSSLKFQGEGDFFSSLRQKAAKKLTEIDFPTNKDELWRYTPLKRITHGNYTTGGVAEVEVNEFLIPGVDTELLVLVNGYFSKSLSVFQASEELFISSLSEAKEQNRELIKEYFSISSDSKDDFFSNLNMAFHGDGAYIEVGKNYSHDKAIHVLNVITGDGMIVQPRNFLLANSGSKIKVIETFVSSEGGANFTNSVFEFVVQENSSLEYNKIQEQVGENCHISTDHIRQYGDSTFNVNTAVFDGELVRNNLTVEVNGENCETNLNGLYLGKGQNHIGNHTVIDHIKPHSNSNEVYKGILDDKSSGVFDGKVFVRPHAQITNAFQENNNLLLTDSASVNSKPGLEIYADDVKCSHGSTTGQIDEDALFYLRARGISRKKAMKLMIIAFAEKALSKISIDCLLDYIEKKIEERFRR